MSTKIIPCPHCMTEYKIQLEDIGAEAHCQKCGKDFTTSEDSPKWFYALDSKRVGPMPQSELVDLFLTGKLPPETLVWNKGQSEWVQAQKVDGLLPPHSIPPPVPAEPPPVPKNTSQTTTKSTNLNPGRCNNAASKQQYLKWSRISFTACCVLWLISLAWVTTVNSKIQSYEAKYNNMSRTDMVLASRALFGVSDQKAYDAIRFHEKEKKRLYESSYIATISSWSFLFLALVSAGLWIWQHIEHRKKALKI